jgi:thiamine transport system substrate-binding protein
MRNRRRKLLKVFVAKAAKLPEVYTQNVQVPDQPAKMAPDDIARNRDAWIKAWSEVMLR